MPRISKKLRFLLLETEKPEIEIMKPTPSLPGVYIDTEKLLPSSISGASHSLPAFIGYTEKAENKTAGDLTLTPLLVHSLLEYERYFGKIQEKGIRVSINDQTDQAGQVTNRKVSTDIAPAKRNLYYQMQLYFANGGGDCYIVSVGQGSPEKPPEMDALKKGLDALEGINSAAPTLIVFPDAINGSNENATYNLYQQAMQEAASLPPRFVIMDVKTVATFRGTPGIGTNNLSFGAAYYPNLKTQIPLSYEEADVVVEHKVSQGGAPPVEGNLSGNLSSLPRPSTLYDEIKASIGKTSPELPPSAAVAGAYVAVAAAQGIWKAPANVQLKMVEEPSILINDQMQGSLNVDAVAGKSINAIRKFPGQGTLIWGARTLDGNSQDWRYVPVRLFLNYLGESIRQSLQAFVFEPNDQNTWTLIRGSVENFLVNQWKAGALMGSTVPEAFFVQIGLGITMTQDDVSEGRINLEIGLAVVRPSEFIIETFTLQLAVS